MNVTVDPHRVEVPTAALVTHTSAVEAVADVVRLGQDALRRIRLGCDAYGQLCRVLPAMLDPLYELADQTLTGARTALDESALSLRTTVRSYDVTDANASVRLGVPVPTEPKLQLPL